MKNLANNNNNSLNPPNSNTNTENSILNLNELQKDKKELTKILEVMNPGHHEAETNLHIAWDNLFKYFCLKGKEESADIRVLAVISSVIQRLTSAYAQIKALELKTRELDIKEYEHKIKKDQFEQTLKNARKTTKGLSEETLREIEFQLKLL